jgi:hypothetical protein
MRLSKCSWTVAWMGSLVTMCTGQSAVCRNKHEPDCYRCCHCGCALLDDPGSAVCRAHEARRLKPLHASTKTGPNWRPSAVHGPASKFDLQLCAVTCSHLPGKLAPHLLSPTRRRRLREDERASLSQCRPLDDSALQRGPMEPISRTGGHQAPRSRAAMGAVGAVHFALCRVGRSANSTAPAGGPCHSRAQR